MLLVLSLYIDFAAVRINSGGVSIRAHAFAPNVSFSRGTHNRQASGVLKSNIDDKEEWRAFRARLVQNGLPSPDDYSNKVTAESECSQEDLKDSSGSSSTQRRYAHESTPLVEVGTILLSIPTTDLCQALEQQYWHRAVVLITEVAHDTKRGELETVPDEQLAQGANRGRWSYRGILLNRFTDLVVGVDVNDDNYEDDYDSETDTKTVKRQNCHAKGYRSRLNVQRGGDLLGLNMNSSHGHQPTEFICLHCLGRSDSDSDSYIRSVSTNLVGELSLMSLDNVQLLLCKNEEDSYKFSPDDFFTFGGFCSWRPGQLELEMGEGREEWLALSVDDISIMEELKHQGDEAKRVSARGPNKNLSRRLLETGTNMWCNFLTMIDVSESRATERLPSGQLEFYDRMLEVWAEDNLLIEGDNYIGNGNDHNGMCDSDHDPILGKSDSTDSIGPGTLLRAALSVSNDMLLYEHEFIRSLILVIEETPEASVGIMLNHPLAAAVECVEGKEPLPLRYGGPIDVSTWKEGTYLEDFDGEDEEDDEMFEGFLDYQNGVRDGIVFGDDDIGYDDDDDEKEEDDSPFLYIHRDVALGSRGPDGKGGVQLGTSDVWMIKEDDALKSLQSGFLRLEDVMVFSGVCIWEKGGHLGGLCGGGLREQVDALGSLEVIQACNEYNQCDTNDAIETVWDILSKHQNVLVKESFESNVQAAIHAWESCNEVAATRTAVKQGHHSKRIRLSDAAFRAWVGVNLLLDPLGTLIEL